MDYYRFRGLITSSQHDGQGTRMACSFLSTGSVDPHCSQTGGDDEDTEGSGELTVEEVVKDAE